MSNDYDSKSNTQGNETHPEPPPPYTPPKQDSSSETITSREAREAREAREVGARYDGGANEGTPLLTHQPPPQQTIGYAPIPNLQFPPGGPQGNVMPLEALRDRPAMTTCPHCRSVVWSNIDYHCGCCTCLSCLGLLALGFTALCSLIPFCINPLKDVTHICPRCGKSMAEFSRLSGRVIR